MKIGTNTTLYFNCIIQQDLCQHRPSAHITTRRSYMSIEEAWGEFRACSRACKRSPRLVENGHGVRRSAQRREPRTLQCFCQVASAHLLRSWGDEAVDEYGRTSRRRRLSQGRDLRWLNSSSNALYELGTWHNNAMAANGYSMKTVWPETTVDVEWGERCRAVIAWGWMEQETRQDYLVDDTIWVWLPIECFESQNHQRISTMPRSPKVSVGKEMRRV